MRVAWRQPLAAIVALIGLGLGDLGARAGQLRSLELVTEATDLLAGHLTARLPSNAVLHERSEGLMAAPISQESETVLWIDSGKERLVVWARELDALASASFAEGVERLLDHQWDPKEDRPALKELVAKKHGFASYALAPKPRTSGEAASLLLYVFTAHPDGTVQTIQFLANPDAATDAKGAQGLAVRIARTVQPGSRTVDLTARTKRLRVYSKRFDLEVALPARHVVTTDFGPDFRVYHIQPLATIGDESRGELLLYVGHHPHAFHATAPSGSVTELDGQLLGRTAKWQEWSTSTGGQQVWNAEAQIEMFPGDTDDGFERALLLQAYVVGTTKPVFDGLRQLVHAARLVEISEEPLKGEP